MLGALEVLIHMNGRVYDAHLGRFLQPDPVIQAPESAQSWNTYTYAFNNPLVYTDPTGMMSFGDILKIAAAIVIAIYTGGAPAGYWSFLGASITVGSAAAYGVVALGGAAAGAITTGTWKGALIGAFSAVAFYGVGQYATSVGASDAVRAGMHAMTGGIIEMLQGGNFGHGFVSAGLSKIAMSNIDTGNIAADVAVAAVVGGTISEMTGGKFANGAVTAAMHMAFNQTAQEAAWKAAENRVIDALRADGVDVARQVKIATTLEDGRVVNAVADYAFRNGDEIVFGEVKSGMFSKLSGNQKLVYGAIRAGNVSILGADAAQALGVGRGAILRNASITLHALEGSRS